MARSKDKPLTCSKIHAKKLTFCRELLTSWTIFKVCDLVLNTKLTGIDLVKHIMEEGLLPSSRLCPNASCQKTMTLYQSTGYPDGCQWYCGAVNKKNKRKCNKSLSVRTDTWFAKSHLSLVELIAFTFFWWRGYSSQQIIADLQIGNNETVSKWSRKCREVAVQICYGLSEPIGGPGKVVEIDESMFGKRKYNRGKKRNGVWVFGGVERGENKCFLVPVKNRKASTLIPIIQHFIRPGTLILSDCWLAYRQLNTLGYTHATVNHSKWYKDPITGVHTNTVEGMWAHAKRDFIKGGRPKRHIYGHLATFMLHRKLRDEPGEPFVNFVRLGHECKVEGYPEGDHALHLPLSEDDTIDQDLNNSLDDPDEDIEDFRDLLLDWADGEEEQLVFPDTFTTQERHQLHRLCEELGYHHHHSVGEDGARFLIVSRIGAAPLTQPPSSDHIAAADGSSSSGELEATELPVAAYGPAELPSGVNLEAHATTGLPLPDNIEENTEGQPLQQVRVSNRKRKRPTYFNDYVL